MGHWPFATPLLEIDQYDDDWEIAVQVINRAQQLRYPQED